MQARFKAHGVNLTPSGFRLIPKAVWALACAVVNDESGRSARIYLRRARNKVAVGAIRLAALVPQSDGRTLYTWAHPRARAIAALGLAMLSLEVPTRRRGPWEGIIRGIPRGAFCALLASAWTYETVRGEKRRARPSVAALYGRHRVDADLASGQLGYLRALELAGFCYRQQLHISEVQPFEACWPSGYATNRYWIVTSIPTRPLSDDKKRELLALHAAALEIATEQLERVRRRDVLQEYRPRGQPAAADARAAPS